MDRQADGVIQPVADRPGRPDTYAFELFVVHGAADADFVRGYLLPALDLPPAQVLLLDALPLGGMVIAEIDRGVARSRFTVAVLSPAFLADCWAVFGEQLASQISVEHPRVIPLRLVACELPLHLDARVSLDFTDRTCWDAEAARLRDLLHAPAPLNPPIPCPYPGMRPFETKDARWFFGRDPEIEDLVGRLDRGEREIYVIGPSGSGKSSLVQAGLLHVLDSGSSRLGRSFLARTMRPGERPAERLARLLDGEVASPAGLPGAMVDALVARHPPAERVLVFVDQLEELFTLASAPERQRFIDALRALRAEPRCHLVLGLRADFYGALMDSALWPQRAGLARLDVAPLRGAALADAIRGPALRVGVYLEARLCDRLVDDAAGEPGVLPLLQETLRILWDKRRHRYLGLEAYEALGNGGRGLDVAIALRADTMMSALTAAQQVIACRVLVRLVSFGEGRADTRRQQPIGALRSAADDEGEVAQVLQQLVAHRLVTVDGAEADHDALADLSHEALITAWPALRAWIGARRADEQRRRRLDTKVAEWIERGHGAASLLDPVELSEAMQWMASDAARELGYGAELLALAAASRSEIEAVQQKTADAQRRLAMTYLEEGRALLVDGHPMQALPYLVAARIEGIDSRVLRILFAQAAGNLPLVTLIGHASGIASVAFSLDGTRVVTGSNDHRARVWDAMTGKPVTPPLPHDSPVSAAALSPDGTRAVTGTPFGVVQLWDATTGTPVTAPLEHDGGIVAVAFSPDGTRVISGTTSCDARVWDTATGTPLTAPLKHPGMVGGVAFSPDGTRVITWCRRRAARLARVWDAATGELVTGWLEQSLEPRTLHPVAFSPDGGRVIVANSDETSAELCDATTGHSLSVPFPYAEVAAFSPDGARAVTTSIDRTARVWDATTGKPVTARLEHPRRVFAAAFSSDGTRILTICEDNTARVWNATTGQPVTAPLEQPGVIAYAAFSPDGTRVITRGNDKAARIWAGTTGAPVKATLEPGNAERNMHSLMVAFSADGTRMVAAGNFEGATRIWDAASRTPVTPPLEHRDAYIAAFSPDGTRVVIAGHCFARVWDARSGKPVTPLLVHDGSVRRAAFSSDSTRVLTVSNHDFQPRRQRPSWARVWDATTGNPVTPRLEHRDVLTAAAFSVDGTRVLTASDDHIARVWDAITGTPVTPPLEHRDGITIAAFSPDGTRVLTGSDDHTARVWDATTGTPVAPPLEHRDGITIAAFSPDGTRVVTGSSDHTARLWDATTGAPLIPPLEHRGRITIAAFSPDGTCVVTGSDDHTARVSDVSTGESLTGSIEHESAVTAAAFGPDGTWLVTASTDDRTARVWDAMTGRPLTVPLEHASDRAPALSPVGTRVVTVCRDGRLLVWTFSVDAESVDDWRRLAGCSPFAVARRP